MKYLRCLVIVVLLLVLFSCKTDKENIAETPELKTGYQLESVDIQHVKLTDAFWLPIIKRVQEKTIEYAIEKCK